jgi:hypoxanthine phosphoribosyltransferase
MRMAKSASEVSADIIAARAAAECLFDAAAVERAVDQLAVRLALRLHGTHPIVMCVMHGGVILTGELLLRLHFPLEVSYVHATRYRDATRGAALEWPALPSTDVGGRTVLLVDDVLDEGHTLAAVVERLRESGATSVVTGVLVDKDIGRPRPVRVDEAALHCPDRFLFGHGMDYRGHWRNLPGIYALPVGWSAP